MKKAFTLAETMLALSIVGVLLAFIAKFTTNIALDNDLAKFKKAYTGIEDAISYLINDTLFYGTESGFKDTETVTLGDTGETIGQNGVYKFREAIKYRMHYTEDKINCPIYSTGSSFVNSGSGCFATDYGVVFGIPDTDFVKTGVMQVKDTDGLSVPAVPITFYTNYKSGATVDNDAFIVAVTYDGKIYFQYSINKNQCTSGSTQMQCKLEEYIMATTIKNTNK